MQFFQKIFSFQKKITNILKYVKKIFFTFIFYFLEN